MRKLTTSLTLPLTILAALEELFPDLTTRQTLNIHLVGASSKETLHFPVFEEILHHLPALKELNISAIGFELPQNLVDQHTQHGKPVVIDCCDDCAPKGRTQSLTLWKGAYHDFAVSNRYEKPDLAVAFQSGFSQNDRLEWAPTIKYLAQAPHPTMFTTYTELEMKEETAIFRTLGVKFLKAPEINKWRSLVPVLDPPTKNEDDDGMLGRVYGGGNVLLMNDKEGSVYYHHYYWYIIGPKGT